MKEIKTYSDFTINYSTKYKIRTLGRNLAIASQSIVSKVPENKNWIRQVFYHHVFDDERKAFERQIKYMKNFGEFISMDQVVQLVKEKGNLDGRYFSMSFDDGFHNTYTNMMSITEAHDIPVIVYLPTDYIGKDSHSEEEQARIGMRLPQNPKQLSYLNWDECREMQRHKVTFGSHTASHRKLATLNEAQIKQELETSKKVIEDQLKTRCDHFAPPNGTIGVDFVPGLTEKIAKEVGYKTLAAANRGITDKNSNLYLLLRDHLIAAWGNYQLKYFFSKT